MSEKLTEFRTKQAELSRLKSEALRELLNERKEIDRQLREFGYGGNGMDALVEEIAPGLKKKGGGGPGSKSFAQTTCKICRGLPGHDARAHRGQGEKRPFTREELKEKGLPGWSESIVTSVAEEPRVRRRRPQEKAN